MNRKEYAACIVGRLNALKDSLAREFQGPGKIRSFVVDDLLPEARATEIHEFFPRPEAMILRSSLREKKYVAVQMNRYPPLLEEIVYAFQDPAVVDLVSEITQIKPLLPDERLYAGGLSLMTQGNFLNPHLDNSHDHERKNYRVLNLLYYVSPNWKLEDGGNLELWDGGVRQRSRTIVSRYNRLVVMETGRSSWHSVSPVKKPADRCCISNYYFSPQPLEASDYFHVTSFRGRPEEKWRDWILCLDNSVRSSLRKIFKKGIVKTFHIYKK